MGGGMGYTTPTTITVSGQRGPGWYQHAVQGLAV